jgi:methionine--tRNA ligase beta chain
MIKLKELAKLDLRVVTVITCEEIPKSRNFYRFELECGERGIRQIIANLPQEISAKQLINTKIIVLLNIEPRRIMGERSEGLILAADVGNRPYLLKLDKEISTFIPPGTRIR